MGLEEDHLSVGASRDSSTAHQFVSADGGGRGRGGGGGGKNCPPTALVKTKIKVCVHFFLTERNYNLHTSQF